MEAEGGVRSAGRIVGVYVFVGVVWIVVSDRLLLAVAPTEGSLTMLQTAKGWVFVGASALLIYGLVRHSQRELVATNDQLRTVVHQAGILHRILRHNLRNSCSVIGGTLERLAEASDEDEAALREIIRERNDRLVRLSEKSRYFRGFLDVEERDFAVVDLVAAVETQVAAVTDRYPDATVHVDVPDAAFVSGHRYVGEAIEELLENAVEHNPAAEPTAWITVERSGDTTAVRVADDGPGIPRMERETLERGSETQVQHSQGIGLWLVRMTVLESGGSFEIEDRDPRGASVTISLPTAPAPES